MDADMSVTASPRMFARAFAIAWLCALVALPISAGNVGDIATGEIVGDDGKTLQLKTEPCKKDSAVTTFTVPWQKRKLDPKTCPDGSVHEI